MMLSDLSFWVFVVCAVAFVIGVGWLVKSYRDARFAQYFFLREEAALRVKRLMFILVPLAIIVVFLGMRLYGQKEGGRQEPTGTAVAIQTATDTPAPTSEQTPKPSPTPILTVTVTTMAPTDTATIAPTSAATPTVTVAMIETQTATDAPTVPPTLTEESAATTTAIITATTTTSTAITSTATLSPTAESAVVTPSGTFTSTVEPSPTPTLTSTPIFSTITPNPEATIENLVFSRAITPDYKPRNPGTTFSSGDNYIYAFFEYHGMQDGVVWRHVWNRGSEQLISEASLWQWGSDGRAYVFFSPVGGYTPGQYKVQVYVGDELKQSSEFIIR